MRLFINLSQFAAALSESIQQQSRETQGPEHVFHNQLNRETKSHLEPCISNQRITVGLWITMGLNAGFSVSQRHTHC